MMILAAAMLLVAEPVPLAAVEQFRQAEAIRSTQPMKARTLYERAARFGHSPAQATYGMLLFKEGNRTGALRWLKAAAEQGEPRGMLLWGTALFNGDGVAVNRALGYSLAFRAAQGGLPEARDTRSEMELVMSPAERAAAARLIEQARTTASPPLASSPPQATPTSGGPTAAPARLAAPVNGSASGNWRIQLGAFRKDGSAEQLFAKLAPKLGGKQASFLPLGSMTRLLAGPYATRMDAQAACRSLGPRQACFPVAPR